MVFSPKELHAAAGRLQDRDLILIDTAGRSPNNQLHINELRNYFNDMPLKSILLSVPLRKKQMSPDWWRSLARSPSTGLSSQSLMRQPLTALSCMLVSWQRRLFRLSPLDRGSQMTLKSRMGSI